jgi:hypothetical protein
VCKCNDQRSKKFGYRYGVRPVITLTPVRYATAACPIALCL